MEESDQRERRRREILDAAKQVFAERGYHHASISDIIARAGIARGTFYLYFSNKHKIFESILDHAIDDLRQQIRRVELGDGAPKPSAQLHTNVTNVLGYVLGDRALIQILLNHGLAPDSKVKERVDAFYDDVRELMEAALTQGIERGWLRRCDVVLVSAGLLGMARGMIERLIGMEPPPDLNKDLDKVAAELISVAFLGVGAPAWSAG